MKKNIVLAFAMLISTSVAMGSGTGVFSVAERNVENFTAVDQEILFNVDVLTKEELVIESANRVSTHYMGSGSTFSVDWQSRLVEFEDTSISDFNQVVSEAEEIEK